jgi:hypothetical protein
MTAIEVLDDDVYDLISCFKPETKKQRRKSFSALGLSVLRIASTSSL